MPLVTNDLHKRMLDGESGEPVRQGMELTIELARFWGAEKLIPIRSVHMVGAGVKTARRAGRPTGLRVGDAAAQKARVQDEG